MAEPRTPTSRGATFLVVDDDPMVRKLVSRGLEPLEPEAILEVEDGLAAQEVLKGRKVDVVVTDVLMPNMDGRELMKWAQEHCPGPLWIVLSGLETFDAAIDALHLGAFDFLPKPPEVQRVQVAVRNALDQIELVRERERLYHQVERSNDRLAEKVNQLENVCRMLEDQAEVIQADLDRAEVIQRALLPQEPPEIDGWCVDSLYRPGSSVGGDLRRRGARQSPRRSGGCRRRGAWRRGGDAGGAVQAAPAAEGPRRQCLDAQSRAAQPEP
jgi:sigma-B regulation protein RsbU (phosphoserine phosphatase)